MRVMWFYQANNGNNLWFFTVSQAVAKCIQHGIAFLDIGPSSNAAMEEVKTKFGFTTTMDWNAQYSETGCEYAGSYLYLEEDNASKTL